MYRGPGVYRGPPEVYRGPCMKITPWNTQLVFTIVCRLRAYNVIQRSYTAYPTLSQLRSHNTVCCRDGHSVCIVITATLLYRHSHSLTAKALTNTGLHQKTGHQPLWVKKLLHCTVVDNFAVILSTDVQNSVTARFETVTES